VLGRFRLLTADTPIIIPARLRKPQELLQALIAFGGTEVGAGVLIDALWPDSEGDAAYHALESALYRLRQLLGARDAVRMEGGKVSLNRDQLRVDMWDFEAELQRILKRERSSSPLAKIKSEDTTSQPKVEGDLSGLLDVKPKLEDDEPPTENSLWASASQLTLFRATAKKIAEEYLKSTKTKLMAGRARVSSVRDYGAYSARTTIPRSSGVSANNWCIIL